MPDSVDEASLKSQFWSWVSSLWRRPPHDDEVLGSTCSKCSKVHPDHERSSIDSTMCRECGKQCLRCYSYPYDNKLRLCRVHWEEHCLTHPEAQQTCPECSKTVPASEIGEGVCELCRARRSWQVCPKCNKLGAMKSKKTCWECWDGG